MQIDYSSHLDYLWALMPETVLTAGAVLLLMYDGFSKRDSADSRAVGWGSLVVLVLAAIANFWLIGVEEPAAMGMVAVDGYRIFTHIVRLHHPGGPDAG
jgi:NADH:ubiquinone oxidoreductase subunit 2 (subunit N)